MSGAGNIEVNAFQRLSSVAIQKSTREGFGLVASEALWKDTPVVAGNAGGIPLQMADGAGGVLVGSVDECVHALVTLLQNHDRARALARSGRERVRNYFVLPRLLLNELELMEQLAAGRQIVRLEEGDPVCGMSVAQSEPAPQVEFEGSTYRFCSELCRRQFLRNPAHYAVQKR